MLKISRLSVEHVRIPVVEIVAGAPADVSAFPVAFAVKAGSAKPSSGDYTATTWETDTTSTPNRYWALVEVDGPALGPGTFSIWLKIAGSGDVVQREAGDLRIE